MDDIAKAMAVAMKARRAELSDKSLDDIWGELVGAAIGALDDLGVSKFALERLVSGDLRVCDGYCHEE